MSGPANRLCESSILAGLARQAGRRAAPERGSAQRLAKRGAMGQQQQGPEAPATAAGLITSARRRIKKGTSVSGPTAGLAESAGFDPRSECTGAAPG